MALQAAIAAGWDIEEGLVLSKYTTLSPIDLALLSEKLEVVKLLVEHGVNLNVQRNPAFLNAFPIESAIFLSSPASSELAIK